MGACRNELRLSLPGTGRGDHAKHGGWGLAVEGVALMAAPGENLRINPDRLWDSIHALAEIGPGIAGGSNRQTLTDDDAKGRSLFKKWCEDAGLKMGLDQMGTMFARREGTEPNLDPVYVGSHLDTQPTAGATTASSACSPGWS